MIYGAHRHLTNINKDYFVPNIKNNILYLILEKQYKISLYIKDTTEPAP